jgi:hypothetical protein
MSLTAKRWPPKNLNSHKFLHQKRDKIYGTSIFSRAIKNYYNAVYTVSPSEQRTLRGILIVNGYQMSLGLDYFGS